MGYFYNVALLLSLSKRISTSTTVNWESAYTISHLAALTSEAWTRGHQGSLRVHRGLKQNKALFMSFSREKSTLLKALCWNVLLKGYFNDLLLRFCRAGELVGDWLENKRSNLKQKHWNPAAAQIPAQLLKTPTKRTYCSAGSSVRRESWNMGKRKCPKRQFQSR